MGHPLLNTGEPEQEVLTPPSLIARVVESFGGRSIALDPCSPTFAGSSVGSEAVVRDPRFEPGARWTLNDEDADPAFVVVEPRGRVVLGRWIDDGIHDEIAPASMLDKKGPWTFLSSPAPSGLDVPWVDRTFANPPFSDLEEWLAKALAEANREDAPRIVVLAPWRSHRAWFLDALKASPRRPTVTLEPGVRFVGHAAKFPAPIALVAWGCVVPPTPEGVVGQFLSHAEITT